VASRNNTANAGVFVAVASLAKVNSFLKLFMRRDHQKIGNTCGDKFWRIKTTKSA
jgi:hypothetical protein